MHQSAQTEAAASAERRRVRNRANQMQRALAAVHVAVDALSGTDRLVVLNEALSQALQEEREREMT
jgi:hypothetical protein